MLIMATSGNDQEIDYQYDQFGWQLQQVVVGEYKKQYQNILVVMPGMRFQRSETKAFQISLAGVIVPNEVSFPLPMASWFYRFSFYFSIVVAVYFGGLTFFIARICFHTASHRDFAQKSSAFGS
jgi:hypothetical protein